MTAMTAVSELTSRIATLTSIARTVADDAARHERHNGNVDAYDATVSKTVVKLRKLADELEKTIQ